MLFAGGLWISSRLLLSNYPHALLLIVLPSTIIINFIQLCGVHYRLLNLPRAIAEAVSFYHFYHIFDPLYSSLSWYLFMCASHICGIRPLLALIAAVVDETNDLDDLAVLLVCMEAVSFLLWATGFVAFYLKIRQHFTHVKLEHFFLSFASLALVSTVQLWTFYWLGRTEYITGYDSYLASEWAIVLNSLMFSLECVPISALLKSSFSLSFVSDLQGAKEDSAWLIKSSKKNRDDTAKGYSRYILGENDDDTW